MLTVTAAAEDRDVLERTAREATATGLQLQVEHPLKWPWARQAPVRATISEKSGCACSLLGDDADWNAEYWAMRPEVLDRLARVFQILADAAPRHLTVEALWAGERARETISVTAAELVALAGSSRLGTRARYEVV